MSSIYDNKANVAHLDGGSYKSSIAHNDEQIQQPVQKCEIFNDDNPDVADTVQKKNAPTIKFAEMEEYKKRSNNAIKLVDDIVLKNYLAQLSDMPVVPITDDALNLDDIILFKINKMVYERDEYATDKFISVVSAMTYTDSSIYLIVDGHKNYADFYLGIKCNDANRKKSSIAETFKSSLEGQFPGVKLEDISYKNIDTGTYKHDKLLHRITEGESVSSYVGVPSYKNSKGEYTNANFIQGIEKFASAMHGKEYTAIILASNISRNEIANLRNGYENIYTELSAMATKQLAYSTNESLANAISRTKGTSDAYTNGYSEATAHGTTSSKSTATTKSESKTHQEGETKENLLGQIGKGLAIVGGAVASVAVVAATGGAALPAVIATGIAAAGGAGVVASVGGAMAVAGAGVGIGTKSKNKSDSTTTTNGSTDTETWGESDTETKTISESKTHTDNFSETDGTTSTIGSSKNFTITIEDKRIKEIQKRIDKQLERIEMCESTGLWSTSAYFISYNTDKSTAETGATIFRSIMQGEQSGIEISAINTWHPVINKDGKIIENPNFPLILKYISGLSHPIFRYNNGILGEDILMSGTSFLSSKEVAILVGLPRKSVPGLPVIEHISLAKEVVRLDNDKESNNNFNLGCIFDQGVVRSDNKVLLDAKSLTQHTFVTGSTGCGKSNTIYYLINQIKDQHNAPKFLVIEPAKGEYKDVFGNEHIYGTNPLKTPLLKINPFRFPEGVHVLEHIDRLIEIFNVCWPMYAAMPAVLKEAILNAYEDCGWDLYKSTNKYSNNLYPTFADLQNELILVINNSAYSEEVKSNYQGSLVTRVKSLNNGICNQIFTSKELGDQALFDENVIIDLSRIGSQETKSLIMGILIMRLSEYRSNSDIPHNSELRHITILEEAHNILKRCSQEQNQEGSNVAGKSVEMIANAIAEMRTYGEGFIIVDQSPGAVDVSAIRNTNTKIIMRLPEENDRRVAGKSCSMKDNQIDEISKLPTGVAVVYQNDWESPVLCKIGKFDKPSIKFEYIKRDVTDPIYEDITIELLKLLLKGRVNSPLSPNIDLIKTNLDDFKASTFSKMLLFEAVSEYCSLNTIKLWEDINHDKLARLVSEIIAQDNEVNKLVQNTTSFEQLTLSLNELVTKTIPQIPDELKIVVSQCLMKNYSLGSEVRLKVYSAWYQSVRSLQNS